MKRVVMNEYGGPEVLHLTDAPIPQPGFRRAAGKYDARAASGLYPVFDELTTVTAFLNIAPWASAYIGPDAAIRTPGTCWNISSSWARMRRLPPISS